MKNVCTALVLLTAVWVAAAAVAFHTRWVDNREPSDSVTWCRWAAKNWKGMTADESRQRWSPSSEERLRRDSDGRVRAVATTLVKTFV